MSWKAHVHDLWKKIVVYVVGAVILGMPVAIYSVYSWVSTVVHAEELKADLEALAQMIGAEVAAQVQPIAQQSQENARQLCLSRRTGLRTARQALVDDVDKLQQIDERSDAEDLLLKAWKAELAETEDEIAALGDCGLSQ